MHFRRGTGPNVHEYLNLIAIDQWRWPVASLFTCVLELCKNTEGIEDGSAKTQWRIESSLSLIGFHRFRNNRSDGKRGHNSECLNLASFTIRSVRVQEL